MKKCNHCCADCVHYRGGNKPICDCSNVAKMPLTKEEEKIWRTDIGLGHPFNIDNEEEINKCACYEAHLELDEYEDIESETTYSFGWTCPYCGAKNTEYNHSETDENFECTCEECGKIVEFGAHFI
jgi:hypothetical protein